MTKFVLFISIDFRLLIIDSSSQPNSCFLYQLLTIGTSILFLRRHNAVKLWAVTDLLKYNVAHWTSSIRGSYIFLFIQRIHINTIVVTFSNFYNRIRQEFKLEIILIPFLHLQFISYDTYVSFTLSTLIFPFSVIFAHYFVHLLVTLLRYTFKL